jgi:aquaporin Z
MSMLNFRIYSMTSKTTPQSTIKNADTIIPDSGLVAKLGSEFIGTLALVLIGCGSAVIAGTYIGFLGISLAFGLTVTAMAYAVGGISGGHFNPAVTFGLWIAKKIDTNRALLYVIAQIIGAVAGSSILYIMTSAGYGQNFIQPGFTPVAAVVGEFMFTALFLLVILGSTVKSAATTHAPLAIGFFLTLAHLVLIPVTGTSLNPARSIAPAIYAGGASLEQLWIFIVIPLLGAAAGALFWKYVLNDTESE